MCIKEAMKTVGTVTNTVESNRTEIKSQNLLVGEIFLQTDAKFESI